MFEKNSIWEDYDTAKMSNKAWCSKIRVNLNLTKQYSLDAINNGSDIDADVVPIGRDLTSEMVLIF